MNKHTEEDIDDDYYDSDEWIEIEQANREYFEPEPARQINHFKITEDTNWSKLKDEKHLPALENLQVAKIANCRFTIWLDSDSPSAMYDVSYASGKQILGRHLNGTWDRVEPRLETENRALDAVRTMVIRSNDSSRVRFTRMYESKQVKQQVREINLIELNDGLPIAAWFIVANNIYPARLDKNFEDKYQWCFNGRNKIHIDKFCDWCWEVIK
jgi:hypothetical protein